MGWVGYDKYVTQLSFLPSVESSDAGLSHIFPESKSTDGSSPLKSKWCVVCKAELSIDSFYYNRVNATYFSSCKSCCAVRSKTFRENNPNYRQGWHKLHPGKQAQYAQRSHDRSIAAGKQKKYCPKSEETLRKSAEASRNKKILGRAEMFESLYGLKFANAYVQLMTSGRRGTGKNALKLLKLAMLPSVLSSESWAYCHRIEKLNIFSRKPYGFTGPWACSCGQTSVEPRFFDIDHIIPRAKGGSNGLYNKQILCPNCHRTKTIKDYKSLRQLAQEQTTCQPCRHPQASAYDIPVAGEPEPTRSGPVSHEKTQCIAAASMESSNSYETGSTSHTPSTFAAPTQSSYTADTGRSGATPQHHGI